ncbi:MAG: dTDP-glucose 4,6-dehydratase [Gammaproteobacteria bacterium 39-13]|nr:dTDP-glucose 4,6-dehydratase [Gammaproteobacteria bacterium]OJV87851.1 MAG: dTDP-glucose 4,6-dehydratase [Gammaproteobacteria bacterium 39-13]
MKNLLITGGAGFIGSNAIDYFLTQHQNYTIINLDKLSYAASIDNMDSFLHHPRHIFVKGDITDSALVEKLFIEYEIEGVIHFAAESHVDNSINQPDIFIKTNVLGTFTLLEAARKYWTGSKKESRFHHISTDEVYGSLGEEGFFTEETPYAPNSPYSASKASSDHLVRSYHKTYGLNTVITNCSNNYGPHQHAEKLIPTIIRKALAGQSIPIYGNGKNVRDWLFVTDHCQAIDKVFHLASAGAHFNVGGNNELSNIDLALLICAKLNELCPSTSKGDYSALINYVTDRPGHDFRYAVSINKIELALGWKPETAFATGLMQTLTYYIHHFKQHNMLAETIGEV